MSFFLSYHDYLSKRFIGQSSRLHVFLEISDKLKLNGYLVTTDIEKAFDLLDHDLVVAPLEKFGFKQILLIGLGFF